MRIITADMVSFVLLKSSLRRLFVLRRQLCSAGTNDVLCETVNNKGIITFNRPKALNALSLPMIRKIYPQMKEWESNPATVFVMIRSVGGKAFCAGGDVKSITDGAKKGEAIASDFFREEYTLNNLIGTYSIPYIALIDGITMGGGIGMSVHGTFRVATERTVFSMPETALGLFPDVGGGYFMPRLGGNLGMYLALTGARLLGRDVTRAGIATHFVECKYLPDLQDALLKVTETRQIPEILDSFQSRSHLDEDKEFSLSPHADKIKKLFDGKSVEEIVENLTKDGSEWAEKQLNILKRMSPTSMKVSFRQLREGLGKSLQEEFQTEYRIARRCVDLRNNDFFEGCRAILVDKDNDPKWQPATLEEVSDEKVASYFAPFGDEAELAL